MKRIFLFGLMLFVLTFGGCRDAKRSTGGSQGGKSSSKSGGAMNKDTFRYTIDSLNHLEQFQTEEVQGKIAARVFEIQKRMTENAPAGSESTLSAAWPESESMRQIVDRLNTWIHNQPPPEWKPDPMLAKLPDSLKSLPMVAGMDKMEFDLFDGFYLQEAVYLRGVSLAVRGKSSDDLTRASRLFDWTIRNIQLSEDSSERIPQFPWEALFFGRGTAMERAWVFVLLARQQDLDAAILAVEKKAVRSGAVEKQDEEKKAEDQKTDETKAEKAIEEVKEEKIEVKKTEEKKTEAPSPAGEGPVMMAWCVAVKIEGKAYLFDTAWGLPIPGPDGVKKGPSGELSIAPATLEQLVADPSLLARMSVDAEHPYSVAPDDLKRVVAYVEASPSALSRRMKSVESNLQGEQKMVLTASATEQAERWKKVPDIAGAELWQMPYETVRRRSELKPGEIAQRLTSFLPFYAMPTMLLRRDEIIQKNAKTPEDKRDIYKGASADKNGKGSQTPADVIPDTEADKIKRIGAELSREGTLNAAPLYKGRVLQLKGELSGEISAMHYYLLAMPSDEELRTIQRKRLEEILVDALKDKKVSAEEKEKLIRDMVESIMTGKTFKDEENQKMAEEIKRQYGPFLIEEAALIVRGKQDASYWLGLVTYERANYPASYNYFGKFTLDAWPRGPWTVGATYNLARSLEAGGEFEAAAKIYRANREAPDAAGLLLRAKWLGEVNAGTPKENSP